MITAQEAFLLSLQEKQNIIDEVSGRLDEMVKRCVDKGLTETTVFIFKSKLSVVIGYLESLGYSYVSQKDSEQFPRTSKITFSWDLS